MGQSDSNRILVIGSYVHQAPYQIGLFDGFDRRMQEAGLSYFRENFDYPSFMGEDHDSYFETYLESKYVEPLDLIVCFSNPASEWLKVREGFHPQAKRIFMFESGVNEYGPSGENSFNLTLKEVNISAVLRLAEAVSPGEDIYIIYDERSQLSVSFLVSLQSTSREIGLKSRLVSLVGDFGEVRSRLERLPDGSSVLFLPFFRDEGGSPETPINVLNSLVEGLNLKIYTMWDSLLKHGVLGGRVLMSRNIGKDTAEQGLRLLMGEPLLDEESFKEGQSAYVFDDEVRRRWGIAKSRLPAGSIFVNERPRFFEQYYWQSLVVIGVLVALAIATLTLRFAVKRKTALLTIRNEELNTALGQKNRLTDLGRGMSMLVHDLRNPICTIKTCCDLLDEMDSSEFNSTWVIKTMNDSSLKSLSMISDMLDYVRTFEPKLETLSAEEFLKLLEEDIAAVSRVSPGIPVLCSLEGECDVSLDTMKVSRVVVNLVKNSLEALGGCEMENPVVRVTVKVERGETSILVSDNGPGIGKDIAENLFDPFRSSGKEFGTGLGLAISREFVEAHKGVISCETKPGETVFKIVLPNPTLSRATQHAVV